MLSDLIFSFRRPEGSVAFDRGPADPLPVTKVPDRPLARLFRLWPVAFLSFPEIPS